MFIRLLIPVILLAFNIQYSVAQSSTWLNFSTVNRINDLAEEEDFIWVATDGGLVKWNKVTDTPDFFDKSGEGALMTSIENIEIDDNGVKWLATSRLGLVRFDGTNVERYNTDNTSGWASNEIADLTFDDNGTLWLAVGGGIVELDTATMIGVEHSFSSYAESLSICKGGNNDMWVGTEKGLYHMQSGVLNYVTGSYLGVDKKIYDVDVNTQGTLYMGTSNGFLIYDGVTVDKAINFNYDVNSIYILNDTTILASTNGTNGIFDGSLMTTFYYASVNFTCLLEEDGTIWFGGNTYNLVKGPDATTEKFDIRNTKLHGNWIRNISTDGDEAWITTTGTYYTKHALSGFVDNKWSTYHQDNTAHLHHENNSLFIDDEGYKWLGSTSGDIVKFKFDDITTYPPGGSSSVIKFGENPSGDLQMVMDDFFTFDGSDWVATTQNTPVGVPYKSFAYDNTGVLWTPTLNGLYENTGLNSWQLHGSHLVTYYDIDVDKSNRLWLSKSNGITVYDRTSFTEYNSGNVNGVNLSFPKIDIDDEGVIWGASFGGYLFKVENDVWTIYPPDQTSIPDLTITALSVDSLGNVWIGTPSGLAVFNELGVSITKDVYPHQETNYIGTRVPEMREELVGCGQVDVVWGQKLEEPYKLYFSSDNGASWSYLAYVNQFSSYYRWDVRAIQSSECKLRMISSADQSDTINWLGTFTINYALTEYYNLGITSPVENEMLQENTTTTINWTADNIPYMKIRYSTNGGETFYNVIGTTSNTGTYDWYVPGVATTDMIFRVSGTTLDECRFTEVTVQVVPSVCCGDCYGTYNGLATVDDCGVCSGGETGITPNSSCTQDCNNIWGGSAVVDSCGNCTDTPELDPQNCITSVSNNIEVGLVVYPNPTNKSVQFSRNITYKLFNSLGMKLESGEGQYLNLEKYADGIYVIKCDYGVFKIIKG